MDDLLAQCGRNFCNVEFLFDFASSGDVLFGVRLRPYGRSAPKNKMVLAGAYTAEEALQSAVSKASAGRWEPLDWAARPWKVDPAPDGEGWFRP